MWLFLISTRGSSSGFSAGFGASGNVMVQLYNGLSTVVQANAIEHRSLDVNCVTVAIFSTDI